MLEIKTLMTLVIIVSGISGFIGALIAHWLTKSKMKTERHVSSFNTIASRSEMSDFIDGISLDELTESENK